MTRESSRVRARQLAKPEPVMIARMRAHGTPIDFPVSEADLDTDAVFWSQRLGEYGVGRASRIVVTASSFELPWYQPVRMAANAAGASYSNVETWGWDAKRLDMFCRRMPVSMVVGLTGETVVSLAEICSLPERLAKVTLLVRSCAVGPLADAGIRSFGVIAAVGPAVAVSRADGTGICYDTSQWTIESDDGELVVSSSAARAARFDRQRTGVRATIRDDGGPRITFTD